MAALPTMTRFLVLAILLGAGIARAADPKSGPAEPPSRAQVIIVRQPDATVAFKPDPAKVRDMVRLGIQKVAGTNDSTAAWRSLVSTQDTVGLKVCSAPGPLSGTRPAVVGAVVQELLAAGLPARQLIIWDRKLADLRKAGFVELAAQYGVRAAGSSDEGWDEKQFYESPLLGRPVWGDLEFGRRGSGIGRKSYVSSLVSTQMTRIINITPLLNHNLVGVSGNLYGLAMDSVDNTLRFHGRSELFRAVPEIYALPVLGDRVALNIVDALICQYQGEETMLLHYSTVLNQLRFSTDPVALDVLSIQELQLQREAAQVPPLKVNMDPYQIATEVWIGVSDTNRIRITTVP